MLQAIREKSQGWFAWLILTFITIPFALWGIQSYLEFANQIPAAKVDGEEISSYDLELGQRQIKENLRQRLGANYRPDMFDDKVLAQQALEQLINDKVLERAAKNWKMRAGDDFVVSYIHSLPRFQNDGHFDAAIYKNFVRNRGQSGRSFEEDMRGELIMSQLRNGIMDTAFVTDSDLADAVRYTEQKRELAMLRISAAKLAEAYQPDDSAVSAYYDQHTSAFLQPERVKIEYVVLEPDALASKVDLSEDLVRSYYDQHKSEFFVPEERLVRHILINVADKAPQADVDSAEGKVKDLLARLRAGEDFAELAKQYSQDPGSASRGGEVGWIDQNIGFAQAFKDAAFALETGKVSEPIRTPFGFHLIEVQEIKPGGQGSFEQLRGQVEVAYAKVEAEKLFYDQSEKLEDLLFQNTAGLKPVADALGVELNESDWFDRNGAPSGLNSPKIAAEAFSEEVLAKGGNSQPIELGDDKVAIIRVVEHQAEQALPLDSVRDRIIAKLKQEHGGALAKVEGERLLASVQKGESSLQAHAESGSYQMNPAKLVTRRDTSLPQAAVSKGFSLQKPADGQATYVGVELPEGDYAIVALTSIKDGELGGVEEKARTTMQERMRQRAGNAQFSMMGQYLRSKSEVSIPPQAAQSQ